ncbi:MAG: hypoxanthine phosphoribosyltransferase [Candidatus Dormibacteraeota bacterium]|nr:hypoxanthine phosphoribosyltransferase [Candidatus Dormibacteraeota bacterium]
MSTSIPRLGEIVVDASSIQRRVGELAAAIDAHYAAADSPVVLLCVLKGALLFTADLARRLTVPCEIEFVKARSYRDGTQSSGTPQLADGGPVGLADRDVLIVEDIVDTGHTAALLHQQLAVLGARSVRLVTLLDKTARRTQSVHVDWKGFDINDRFVVGYGLDHGERYRNLADVRVLDGA